MQAFNRLGPITQTINRAAELLGVPVIENGFLHQAQVIEELARRVSCPTKPEPIKYTTEEGGEWYAWVYRPPQRPFSIMFEDGSIFDPIVGWQCLPRTK